MPVAVPSSRHSEPRCSVDRDRVLVRPVAAPHEAGEQLVTAAELRAARARGVRRMRVQAVLGEAIRGRREAPALEVLEVGVEDRARVGRTAPASASAHVGDGSMYGVRYSRQRVIAPAAIALQTGRANGRRPGARPSSRQLGAVVDAARGSRGGRARTRPRERGADLVAAVRERAWRRLLARRRPSRRAARPRRARGRSARSPWVASTRRGVAGAGHAPLCAAVDGEDRAGRVASRRRSRGTARRRRSRSRHPPRRSGNVRARSLEPLHVPAGWRSTSGTGPA